jgi:hypothetical protein
MELKQLYTDLILEYNKDKTNKRKIENPTVHEHGHNPSCGDDIDIEVKIEDGVIKEVLVENGQPVFIPIYLGSDRTQPLTGRSPNRRPVRLRLGR